MTTRKAKKGTALIWSSRFPGAVADAGPFRFHNPVNEREYRRFLCTYFGIDSVPKYTRIWVVTEGKDKEG